MSLFGRGYDVMVACQLPKLIARVRFPLPAPFFLKTLREKIFEGFIEYLSSLRGLGFLFRSISLSNARFFGSK